MIKIKIKNSILGVGLAFASLTTFTGCIDETLIELQAVCCDERKVKGEE